MLWSMGLQRVGHDLVTEQQKQFSLTTCIIHFWRAALTLIHLILPPTTKVCHVLVLATLHFRFGAQKKSKLSALS